VASHPHLLVDISSHGYGHVSQTSAVVNELVQLMPDLRVTVRTTSPHAFLESRFQCEFEHIPVAFDFGMKMANAVDVQIAESAHAYREFHADWAQKVEREARVMRELKPDLLLANVPYLSLAAAHVAGVRALAMCCLNWADIYRHYCAEDAASQTIHGQMLEAYQSAACFLKVQPAMEMPALSNTRNIQPIARLGRQRRCHIAANSNQSEGEKLVLVAMGGMEFQLPLQNWPHLPGIRWIVPQAWDIRREDTTSFESLNLNFTDVLASCDAVITKPGYGMFTEAACNGVPVLYLTRRNWPEEYYLVQWLRQNVACLEVSREALLLGSLGDSLEQLWGVPQFARPGATGAIEAAEILASHF
jgi:UDP:flavonoid glycosyltransferase YjiC (YdhE family)